MDLAASSAAGIGHTVAKDKEKKGTCHIQKTKQSKQASCNSRSLLFLTRHINNIRLVTTLILSRRGLADFMTFRCYHHSQAVGPFEARAGASGGWLFST